jgi:hypothetical protein
MIIIEKSLRSAQCASSLVAELCSNGFGSLEACGLVASTTTNQKAHACGRVARGAARINASVSRAYLAAGIHMYTHIRCRCSPSTSTSALPRYAVSKRDNERPRGSRCSGNRVLSPPAILACARQDNSSGNPSRPGDNIYFHDTITKEQREKQKKSSVSRLLQCEPCSRSSPRRRQRR